MPRIPIPIRAVTWLLGMSVLALLPAAWAEEEKPLPLRVLAAHARGDAEALSRLAREAGTHAWDIAEAVLSVPGGDVAALAFAKVWADPDHDALLRYVKGRKGKSHPPEAERAVHEARAALRAGRAGVARGLLEGAAFEPETIAAIRTLELRSLALGRESRADEGIGLLLEAATSAERIGWRAGAAGLLRAAALLLQAERDFAGAREVFERRYNLLRSRGDRGAAASCLGNLASACALMGDFPAAFQHYAAAIEALTVLHDARNAALTRSNLGSVYLDVGQFERALTHSELALAQLGVVGTDPDRAETMAMLGNIRQKLGQPEQALAHHEKAVEIMRAHVEATAKPTPDDIYPLAIAVGNCGNSYMVLERYAEARDHLGEALDLFGKKLGDPFAVAVALSNLAELAFRRGDLVGATAQIRAAVSEFEKLGADVEAAEQRIVQGRILAARKRYDDALACFRDARAAGERLRLYSIVVDAMTEEADVLLVQGKLKEARRLAFGAVDVLGGSLAHLADGESGDARSHRLRTYQLPIRVAIALGNEKECAEALDEARAGTFLEAFGGRTVLQDIAMPRDLARQLRRAQAVEGKAWVELSRAKRNPSLPRRREAQRRLDAARKRTHAVHETIQRTAKQAADLVYPRADDLADVRAELEPGDALVIYALLPKQSVALVITPENARIRHLPPEAKIVSACEALLASSDAFVDPAQAPALAEMIIAPLGLTKDVRRLLISPDGALTYVPFSLLLPDRDIVYVPSGTFYRTLRAAKDLRGTGIIAFGDPVYEKQKDARRIALYGGTNRGRLTRLPESGDEARAVGDRVFVREEATEARLREVLTPAREGDRIRALHLAGHGFANAEIPQLSCIALTPSGDDDGFLLTREVMAMEVPADLVVLSACESVRGKVVRGEGLQGLVRAFMFAGAPRVLASLWKVDDEPARVFMEKFYELWIPSAKREDPERPQGVEGAPPKRAGLSTAAALRGAQTYLRTETKWKHAEHWSAWVLWGLPD